jgi:hypothetical protein
MASRQTGQKEKHSQHKPSEQVEHEHIEREANLGQKEARLDKENPSCPTWARGRAAANPDHKSFRSVPARVALSNTAENGGDCRDL